MPPSLTASRSLSQPLPRRRGTKLAQTLAVIAMATSLAVAAHAATASFSTNAPLTGSIVISDRGVPGNTSLYGVATVARPEFFAPWIWRHEPDWDGQQLLLVGVYAPPRLCASTVRRHSPDLWA